MHLFLLHLACAPHGGVDDACEDPASWGARTRADPASTAAVLELQVGPRGSGVADLPLEITSPVANVALAVDLALDGEQISQELLFMGLADWRSDVCVGQLELRLSVDRPESAAHLGLEEWLCSAVGQTATLTVGVTPLDGTDVTATATEAMMVGMSDSNYAYICGTDDF